MIKHLQSGIKKKESLNDWKKKISVTQHSCILVFNTIADLKETEIFGELANPRPGAGTAQEKPYLYQQRSYQSPSILKRLSVAKVGKF